MSKPADPSRPLGLIAGEGIFPLLVARGAKAAGRSVACIGLSGCAWDDVRDEVDSFKWVGLTRLGQWVRTLRNAGCTEAIMVGRVVKTKMYGPWRWVQNVPDLRTAKIWLTELRHDRRPGTILKVIARELAAEGITLIDSTEYTKDQLATAGVMTRRAPTAAQEEDARYGWDLCQKISRLDIGQSIAVKNKDVLAVEALEGTNAMIERAGTLCRTGGWTLIKVANSEQDMRMDVPTIGRVTIEKLKAAGAGCVVLEAGKTILLEREVVLKMADEGGIAVIGIQG